ncbi:MAG: GNAT family N-acetyltransferase [Proteobacteria bacterium]|nr:GNAT family N-acetyltransferase [Pseudomonadota bacterium]MBI3495910.1 GNAT family N-acetyltransferase [Pseudomonadota bacterium]
MRLRDGTPADIEAIVRLENDPTCNLWVSQWTAERHLAALVDGHHRYVVAESDAGDWVGFAFLRDIRSANRCIEMQRIAVNRSDAGYGRALMKRVTWLAFEEYSAHRVWFDVIETNARARHVYRSLGFVEEGVFREAKLYQDGFYYSLVLMAMLEGEYRQRRALFAG